MTAPFKLADYAPKPVIDRTARRVRDALGGVDPVAVEVAPGGVIRFYGPGAFPAPPADEFEALEREGKL